LPFGGLLIVTFVGWFMGTKKVKAELSNEGKLTLVMFSVFQFILRYLAPIAIILLLLFYKDA
jgi:NSS family neurotransmitter:Na+ symporter